MSNCKSLEEVGYYRIETGRMEYYRFMTIEATKRWIKGQGLPMPPNDYDWFNNYDISSYKLHPHTVETLIDLWGDAGYQLPEATRNTWPHISKKDLQAFGTTENPFKRQVLIAALNAREERYQKQNA